MKGRGKLGTSLGFLRQTNIQELYGTLETSEISLRLLENGSSTIPVFSHFGCASEGEKLFSII